MVKRVISLLLCLLMLVPVMASCAKKDENDLGAYISMYLTDQVYDLDPAKAYNNESALRVVSLVFDNLFVLDEDGKVKKSLAEDYEISEDDNTGEYEMIITLKETAWTDGTALTANDVYYAWTRVLQSDNSFDAAALLYDIKNARAAKEGEVSIDDVGISAINENQIQIFFEEKIDYDQFLMNLTSYALVPLREDIVGKSDDWAKKPSTICSSGPFRLREVLYEEKEITNEDGSTTTQPKQMTFERNPYYFRDMAKDKIDKSVTPYRIIVNYSMTDEEIKAAYEAGEIFFVGDLPLSIRGEYADEIKESKAYKNAKAMSTHTYFLNQNAVIRYYTESGFKALASYDDLIDWKTPSEDGKPKKETVLVEGTDGEKIFAIPEVREALSLAIDRQAVVDAVYFAEAATGLVPSGVFNSTSKKELFRETGDNLIKSDMTEAKSVLAGANIDPSKFMFAISVAAYDDVHVAIAEIVQKAWSELGFNVQLKKIDVMQNTDEMKSIGEVPKDIMDDLFIESYNAGKFEVAAIDYTALSADAFSTLAQFAKGYTGRSSYSDATKKFDIPTHLTGYCDDDYNALIEEAFAEKDLEARAEILHKAEAKLMEDMPVIPIVFNKTATLTNENLSKIDFTYYGTMIFTKTKLKDYEQYIPADAK